MLSFPLVGLCACLWVIGCHRKEAFLAKNGGRPGATKVMVVVTDGESHDANLRKTVIPACESQNITRFGIAVSENKKICSPK